jgi:hypothetical protein
MLLEQEEFKEEYEALAQTVAIFHDMNNINEHEKIANDVSNINN